jgi:hypothetical protein
LPVTLPETIVRRRCAALIPYARNARTHSDQQVAQFQVLRCYCAIGRIGAHAIRDVPLLDVQARVAHCAGGGALMGTYCRFHQMKPDGSSSPTDRAPRAS